MKYVFAIKTKNPKIMIHSIDADSLEEAQDEARSIIFNSINLDETDYEYILTHDWNLIVKRMCDLKKPISNVELL